MKIVKDLNEDEMIIAFLKAEIDSVRFGSLYNQLLLLLGTDRSIIDNPNINNIQENKIRRTLLDRVRGYGKRILLFTGFPNDVIWKRVLITKDELENTKYANHPTWITLSNNTRLVSEGAKNVDLIQTQENANANIKAVAQDFKKGKVYPELIFASRDTLSGLVLIEGHTRATAYILEKGSMPDEIKVIVGISQEIINWQYW